MQSLHFHCDDGVRISGHLWPGSEKSSVVIVNAATGVCAHYYHRYAAYLEGHDFTVLTYDYRGIGSSRPQNLRKTGFRWSDWGIRDFSAVFAAAERLAAGRSILVVGHSIGGFIPGLARGFERCAGMITVGAQYAYWRDYARASRVEMVLRWHVVMPIVTRMLGYFPGKRLGWLEDLPAGVAFEWAFRRARMEENLPQNIREDIIESLAAYNGPLLAVTASDDPYGSPAAIDRALSYYSSARISRATIQPRDLGVDRIGHFDLFHDRHRDTFWRATAEWLESRGRSWTI